MDEDITLFPEKARIGVAIFAYNEESTVPSIVVLTKPYTKRILVVDDGSNDNTKVLAKQVGAEVISFPSNLGKGYGLKTAFEWAIKNDLDVLVTIDGDGQHDPGIIPFLAEPVIKDKFQITIGSKGFTYQGKSRKGLSWRLGNWMTKKASGNKTRTSIYDRRSGFRAYHKKTFDKFKFTSKGFEQERDILLQADVKGFKIEEIPMKAIYGQMSKEDIGLGNWVLSKIYNTMSFLHITSPIRLSILISLFFFGLTIAAVAYSRVNYSNYEFLPPGGIFVVMVLVSLSGFILLNGIIFEAIKHIGSNMTSYLQKNDQVKLEYDPLKGFQR